MKKTLIALAALAAFGSASAQVTLYGKVDLGMSSTTKTDTKDQGLLFTGNNYESSRYGIKGGTDIGGGMKGSFQVEGGFNAGSGANTAGQIFDRVAKASLSGSFGTVTAGLDWTPYDNAFNDALEYNGFSAMNKAFGSGVHADVGNTGNGNAKNSIQYQTPDMNGFNAVLMYAPGGDATAATDTKTVTNYSTVVLDSNGNVVSGTSAGTTTVLGAPAKSASSYTGLGLNYAKGPLAVNFAYESAKPQGDGNTVTAWIAAGSYELSMAKLFLALEQADAGNSYKDAGVSIGASMPVSAKTTVALGYATETSSANGMKDGTTNSFGLQAVYNMQANLALYAGANVTDAKAKVANGSNDPKTITTNKLAAGFRYNF